jgi:cholesterol oxidase
MTDGTNIKKRRQQWLKQIITKPSLLLKIMDVRQWSQRTVVALIMQNVDSSLTVKGKKRFAGLAINI